jgi:hypothetical protein
MAKSNLFSSMLQAALTAATRGNPERERGVPDDGDDEEGDYDEEFDDVDDVDDDELEHAVGEYEAFHWGNSADSIEQVEIPDPPRTLVLIGELEGVIYRTAKGKRKQESWVHFHDERTPPKLAYDPQTGQLYILGGKYRITPRGIED